MTVEAKDAVRIEQTLPRKFVRLLAIANMAIPALLVLAGGVQGNPWSESLLFALIIGGWHGIGSLAFVLAGHLFDSIRWQWGTVIAFLAVIPPLPFAYAALWTSASLSGFPLIWEPFLQLGVAMLITFAAEFTTLIRRRHRKHSK